MNEEKFLEIKEKHNQLCDLLADMKLNPLADFESLRVEDDLDFNDEIDDSEEINSELDL